MFFSETNDAVLRFGDVIQEHTVVSLQFNRKPNHHLSDCLDVSLDVPKYSVVITPCCSISDGNKAVLTPLIRVRADFFKNNYFAEDLTRINRLVPPDKLLPEDIWNQLPLEKKQMKMSLGLQYALTDYFIYEKNDLFELYELEEYWKVEKTKLQTNYLMIDFRSVSQIISSDLNKPETSLMIRKKVAQLSIDSRHELREKIASFYARVPEEDKIE